MIDEHDGDPHVTGEGEDAAFARRVAEPLRAAEQGVGAGFAEQVMAQVRVERPGRVAAPPAVRWWRRPRTFTIAPLPAFALAASFAVAVSLGTLALARTMADTGADVAGRPATSTVADENRPVTGRRAVSFVLVAPDARSVAVVGDFNGWSRDATPLRPHGHGVWAATVPLPPGRYQYAFIVNGRRWVADPYAPRVRDDFGTESSVVTLSAGACRSSA